jgi:hypothetical protein
MLFLIKWLEILMSNEDGPDRAFVLRLKIDNDTREGLANDLEYFAHRVRADQIIKGVSGGYSNGATYQLCVRDISHDEYFIELDAYLETLKKEKDNASTIT